MGAFPFVVSVVVAASLSALLAVFSGFGAFGFSGSRSVVPSALSAVCGLVPVGAPVFVGCAGGVDATVRRFFPSASVFSVASVSAALPFSARLVARSSACVRACVGASGLWVSFPSGACPVGVRPCASPFSGGGSGSWASAALALFLGAPILFFLSAGVSLPASFSSGRSVFVVSYSVSGSWILIRPVPVLSLF